MAQVLSKADCLLLPSRLESFGMVVLEALASGVPVLVSKWAGASMVIQDGINGWTFDSDYGDFRNRIFWCATHVDELRSMRLKCVEISHLHSWSAYQARAIEIVINASHY
ncbi:MAG: glycosyltransferase family 4 protein [Betaproteobacteria bacterium]|nr:glycosyltransferase family 4 protein [Candidatus Dechloromonas phosphorivorans]